MKAKTTFTITATVDIDEKPDIFLIKLEPLISDIQTKMPVEQTDEVKVFPNIFSNSVTILLNRDYGDIAIGPYFLSIEMPSGKRIIKIVNY